MWHARYVTAANSLDDREARIAGVAEALEVDLELLGVTAIEDKLQARPSKRPQICTGALVPEPNGSGCLVARQNRSAWHNGSFLTCQYMPAQVQPKTSSARACGHN